MKPLNFIWDERKNATNQEKHGVSFEEGRSVFGDDNALLLHDPDHSEDEDRFLLLGISATTRMLVVCHCYKEETDIVRIISVRKATKTENMQYMRRKGR